ncbi:MAG TPA: protein kinase [Gemmataceae bacterium]|nr:protein kinase [Gemmataceae bacterium]
MTDRPCARTDALTPSRVHRLERVCDEFEAAWKSAGSTGQRPHIEDFLGDMPEPERIFALQELIGLDIDYRRQTGETPQVAEYCARFPFLDASLLASLRTMQPPKGDRTGLMSGDMAQGDGLPETQPQQLAHERSLPRAQPPTIFGFEIVSELGRGGMGVVYQAWQSSLHRLVALKMVLAGAHASPQELARFRTEAEAVARLRHPNIVQIYEVGQHGLHPYMVLEYVDSGSLAQRLDGTPLPVRQTAQWVATLAQAVHYAHQCGIVHRDLKPANILLATAPIERGGTRIERSGADLIREHPPDPRSPTFDSMTPKITDFGLAKIMVGGGPALTASGFFLGTPSYMPPEQAEGKHEEVGPASDIYSLGAVFYELLTGRPPFRAATPSDTVRQVIDEEPVPPGRLQPRLPRDLETICLKCLNKLPRRRYVSAAALAEDLHRWLAGRPIHARPSGAGERVLKWARRRPAVAGLLLLVLVVAVAGFSGVLSQWRQTEAARRDAINNAAAEKQMRQIADEQRGQARAALARAETTLYFNRTALAAQMWAANNVGMAEQLLDRCRPTLRGWEWFYLKRLCHAGQRTLRDPSGLLCVACSPNGQCIAAAGWMNMVKIWDANSGRELWTLVGHTREVQGLVYRPDGQRLASVGADGVVIVWEPESGRSCRTWKSHTGELHSVAYSPDGRSLASAGDDGIVRLWDADNGSLQYVLDGQAGKVLSVAFSPDGRQLASGHDDRVAILWDLAMRTKRFTLPGADGSVTSVAFHPQGKQLATASYDGFVCLWDVASGKQTHRYTGHRNGIYSIAYSKDGRLLATASWDHTVNVWDPTAAEGLLQTFRGHTDAVYGVAFRPDGHSLVSGSQDKTVKIWSLGQSQECQSLHGHTSGVTVVRYSPDGQHLASASEDGTVRLWDIATGTCRMTLQGHSDPVWGLATSIDGLRLASAGSDRIVNIWDVATGHKLCRFTGHESSVVGVAFRPHSDDVASSDQHGVQVWRATDNAVRFVHRHPHGLDAVAYSPDGRQLALGGGGEGQPGEILILDADTGKELRTLSGHITRVRRVAFSPDGRLLASASYDKTARVWDVATGRALLTLTGHADWVSDVAFSPDGSRLATSSNDHTTKLWDLASGQETLTLAGHHEWVYGVTFRSDGTQLATCGEDKTIRLWDATPLRAFPSDPWLLDSGTSEVTSAAFSADGQTLALGRKDGRIQLWDPHAGLEKRLLPGQNNPIQSVVISSDGRMLAAAAGEANQASEVKLWDVAAGQERVRMSIDAPGGSVIAFLPDGQGLAAVDAQGFIIWDERSGAVRAQLRRTQENGADQERFQIGAISPDGRLLAAGTITGKLHVWDRVSGRDFPLAAKHWTSLVGLEFTPDSRTLCSAGTSDVVLWDTITWEERRRLAASEWQACLAIAPDGRTLAVGHWQATVQLWELFTASRQGTLYGYSRDKPRSVRFGPAGDTLLVVTSAGGVMLWDIKSESAPP